MSTKPKAGSKAWKCVDDDSGIVIIATCGEENLKKAELALQIANEAFEKHRYVGIFLAGNAIELAKKANKNKRTNKLIKKLIEKDAELMVDACSLKKGNVKEEELIEQVIAASFEEIIEISRRKKVIAV